MSNDDAQTPATYVQHAQVQMDLGELEQARRLLMEGLSRERQPTLTQLGPLGELITRYDAANYLEPDFQELIRFALIDLPRRLRPTGYPTFVGGIYAMHAASTMFCVGTTPTITISRNTSSSSRS